MNNPRGLTFEGDQMIEEQRYPESDWLRVVMFSQLSVQALSSGPFQNLETR